MHHSVSYVDIHEFSHPLNGVHALGPVGFRCVTPETLPISKNRPTYNGTESTDGKTSGLKGAVEVNEEKAGNSGNIRSPTP